MITAPARVFILSRVARRLCIGDGVGGHRCKVHARSPARGHDLIESGLHHIDRQIGDRSVTVSDALHADQRIDRAKFGNDRVVKRL
jgi:hypothetical protein